MVSVCDFSALSLLDHNKENMTVVKAASLQQAERREETGGIVQGQVILFKDVPR